MRRYSLSKRAAEDVETIYKRGVVEFGEAQADLYHEELHESFEMLALFPRSGRQRMVRGHPVRVQPKNAHIIIYEATDGGVHIIRILHRSQDWQSFY